MPHRKRNVPRGLDLGKTTEGFVGLSTSSQGPKWSKLVDSWVLGRLPWCGLRAQLGCVRAPQEVGLVKMCPKCGDVDEFNPSKLESDHQKLGNQPNLQYLNFMLPSVG